MHKRERLFFGVSEITAWKFVGINALTLLHLLHDKKELHGKLIQHLIWKLFGEVWTSGNDLTYTILNTYEEEGYVKSHWEKDADEKKKSLRFYSITDAGVSYLQETKGSFTSNLISMAKILERALFLIWQDDSQQDAPQGEQIPLSSLCFSSINVLFLLYEKKYGQGPFVQPLHGPSPVSSGCMYAQEIKDVLGSKYDGLWQPSDGVIYPMLSDFELKGYVSSGWSESNPKKRTTRCFVIEKLGEEYLAQYLLGQSGIKNKLLSLRELCLKSADLVSGNSTENISKAMGCVKKALAQ